jgi:hypothetical protein
LLLAPLSRSCRRMEQLRLSPGGLCDERDLLR